MRLRIGSVILVSVICDRGEVFSTNHWTHSGGSSTTAAESVAATYENIAKQIGSALKAHSANAQDPQQHASTP